MSCSCNSNPCTCHSCDAADEPLSSALTNFTNAFFGTVTKTCVNNEVVWSLPCDLDSGVPDFPRIAGEGLACYFLRLLAQSCCCFIPNNTILVDDKCYTTFQSAYDAAIALPGTQAIPMYIGETDFPSTMGDLTLTADYDSRVHILGYGKNVSHLGNINATSSGNGFNINAIFTNVSVGNINTSTSDVTGTFNGGFIFLTTEGIVVMGNLNTSALNGNVGGRIGFTNHEYRIGNIDTRGQKGGGIVVIGTSLNYGTYGSQCGNIDTRAMISGTAGAILLGDSVRAVNLDARAMTAGTGGTIVLRKSARIEGTISRGTVSPGPVQFDGCYIYNQMDNIGSGCKFKDVVFFTNSGNRSNILEVLSDGALFTGCFFITDGTGNPIVASVPRTIISHFTISQKALHANVTVSSGTFTVEPNLAFGQ